MHNGTEKYLRDIRPADIVATFDKGKLSSSKINNWQSSGVDSIYKIQTQSGKILRANNRHPFLVMNEGVLEWTRLKYLKPGDLLVSLKGVLDRQDQKQNPENAAHANQETVITENIQTRQKIQLGITANGLVNIANVVSQYIARACARFVIGSNTTPQNQPQRKPSKAY
jgi:hypothetical protein